MSYVGNEMGKLQTKNAKRYTIAGIVIFFIFTILCIILLWFLQDYWVAFYANKPEIKDIMIDVLPWMIFGLILIDGL